MDPESKQLLQKTLELAEENNKMLHKVRGVQKRQALWSAVKVLVIIAIAFGSFYYIEPFLNKAMDTFSKISGTKTSLNSDSLQQMLKTVR